MSKQQWKNLWHSYRWMRWRTTEREAFGWIAHYSRYNAELVRRAIPLKPSLSFTESLLADLGRK